jgi:hypothetical protein
MNLNVALPAGSSESCLVCHWHSGRRAAARVAAAGGLQWAASLPPRRSNFQDFQLEIDHHWRRQDHVVTGRICHHASQRRSSTRLEGERQNCTLPYSLTMPRRPGTVYTQRILHTQYRVSCRASIRNRPRFLPPLSWRSRGLTTTRPLSTNTGSRNWERRVRRPCPVRSRLGSETL